MNRMPDPQEASALTSHTEASCGCMCSPAAGESLPSCPKELSPKEKRVPS